ncbi:hypothetical protein BDK51DRAFT_28590 [Blyttiomyces helicus]|uniref:Uncharacterized protein n=1 Tax=Blyttiomyces helicus TaxID=388810 RepID=A0A4P9WRR5_9FUNG|nr:hypothetical protein BDK51DRAFT_28590 [Blyttiomyces helicus]|eukprot:RKO93626.1 hypothetical protein BDK51DRAFT_28590 [Blyttiomyces helicus]
MISDALVGGPESLAAPVGRCCCTAGACGSLGNNGNENGAFGVVNLSILEPSNTGVDESGCRQGGRDCTIASVNCRLRSIHSKKISHSTLTPGLILMKFEISDSEVSDWVRTLVYEVDGWMSPWACADEPVGDVPFGPSRFKELPRPPVPGAEGAFPPVLRLICCKFLIGESEYQRKVMLVCNGSDLILRWHCTLSHLSQETYEYLKYQPQSIACIGVRLAVVHSGGYGGLGGGGGVSGDNWAMDA